MRERLEDIEERSGLDLGPDARWSVESLNDLGAERVRLLQELDRGDQQFALRHLVRPESHTWLDAFLNATDDGADPETWGTGGVLLPALGFRELLETPVDQVLALLGLDDDPGRCVVVDRDRWERGLEVAGAPGRQLSARVDYRWEAPPGTIRMIAPHPPVSPCDDPAMAVRRWLASRIAFVAPRAPEAMREARLSADARAAVRVLERERDEFGEGAGVPGFLAPAAWYASS